MYEKKANETSTSINENAHAIWSEALEIGKGILIAYKQLYPQYDINTALMALKLGKIASYLEDNKKARGMKVKY